MKENTLDNLVKDNIRKLAPYSSARDEYHGTQGIFLDANENPFGQYNRYPDPYQKELKKTIAQRWQVLDEQLFIGNGSDEVIDLIFRIFCRPEEDKVLTFSPTYGMYEVSASIHNVSLLQLPLTSDFQIDFTLLEKTLQKENVKVIFVCSPNNPTGNLLRNIEQIFEIFDGIVVVDEAYIDFANAQSWSLRVADFPRLLVSRTLSKAYGLAGMRLGIAIANPQLIGWLNKVKPPYNVSSLNQEYALKILSNENEFKQNLKIILDEREKLITALAALSFVKKIYPTDANFVLVEVTNANEIYNYLSENQVIVRNRNKQVNNALRITVGSPAENQTLISVLKSYKPKN